MEMEIFDVIHERHRYFLEIIIIADASFEVLTQTSSNHQVSRMILRIFFSASLLTEGNSVVHCMLLTQLSINIDAADKRNTRWKGSVIYRDTHIDIKFLGRRSMHVPFLDSEVN